MSVSLNGTINRHNSYWDDSNEHLLREISIQYRQKYSSAVAFFIPGNFTGDVYISMLVDAIAPLMT